MGRTASTARTASASRRRRSRPAIRIARRAEGRCPRRRATASSATGRRATQGPRARPAHKGRPAPGQRRRSRARTARSRSRSPTRASTYAARRRRSSSTASTRAPVARLRGDVMEHKQKVTTRRGALGRILGVAFGAAGVGALAGARATDAATPRLPANLTLYAPALRLKKVGERSLPSGGLVDVRERHVGALHTALVDSTAGALTLQTFQLEDGTLQGLG